MADERIGILLEYSSIKNGIRDLESLKAVAKEIDGKTLHLKVEQNDAKKAIADLNSEIARLKDAQTRAINLEEWRSLASAIRSAQNELRLWKAHLDTLRASSDALSNQKSAISSLVKDEQAATKESAEYYERVWRDALDAREEAERKLHEQTLKDFGDMGKLLDEQERKVAEAERARQQHTDVAHSQIRYDYEQARAAEAAARDYEQWWTEALGQREKAEVEATQFSIRAAQEYERHWQEALENVRRGYEENIDGFVQSIGRVLNAVGSVSGWTADVASGLGNAFSGMSSMFQSNIFDTIEKTLTYMATNAFTGHMNQVLSRADIMNTFTQYMGLTGVDEATANRSLQRINQSILGLPIGLDESAQRLRRYQMYLNNVEEATNLTIGLQKAIIAGGASEANRTTAYYQIDRLLSVGKLNTARQWNALINGLGVSVRFLGEAMGIGAVTSRELVSGLADGTYTADQFLKGLERLGDETLGYAEGLDSALEIYKTTYESWMKNIEFAMVRGGERILKSFDASLKEGTGNSIIDYMKSFRDGLNEMYAAVGDFFTAHPAEIANLVSSGLDLINAIKGINFGMIGEGVLGNIARVFDVLGGLLDRFTGGRLESFVAFATTLAGPLGKLLSNATAQLPILLGIFDRFKNFNFEGLIDQIVSRGEALSKFVSNFLSMFSDQAISNIVSFGMTWGKPLASAISAVGSAIASFSKTPMGMKAYESFVSSLANFGVRHAGIAQTIGILGDVAGHVLGIAAALGTLYAAWKAYDNNRRFELGLDAMEEEIRSSERLRESMAAHTEEIHSNIADTWLVAEQARALIEEIKTLNAEASSPEDFANLQLKVAELKALIPDVPLVFDEETQALDANSQAWLNNAAAIDAVIENTKKLALEQALADVQRDTLTARAQGLELDQQIDAAELELQRLQGVLAGQEFRSKYVWDATIGDYVYQTDYNARAKTEGDIRRTSEELERLRRERDANTRAIEENERFMESLEQAYLNSAKVTSEATEEAERYAEQQEKIAQNAKETSRSLEEAAEHYETLKTAANEAIDAQIKGFEKLEIKPVTGADINAGIDSQTQALTNYRENLEKITQYLQEHPDDLSFANLLRKANEEYSAEGVPLTDKMAIFAALAGDIEYATDELSTSLGEQTVAADSASGAEASFVMALEDVAAKADKAKASVDNLTSALGYYYDTNIPIQGTPPKDLFGEEYQYYSNLPRMGESGIAGNIEDAADEAASAAKGLAEGVAEELEKGADQVGQIANAYGSNASRIGHSINGARGSAVSAVHSLIASIARAFASADVGAAINAFAAKTTAQISSAMATISASASGMFNLHGGNGGKFATGGMVYAANGMFIPVGTDTVPSMLTPGEFVINRSATRQVGADVLSMINRYDFGGAVEAMMHRFPTPQTSSYVTNNVQNSDSHNNFTMNVSTQNPHFAERISSRYI